MKLTRLKRIEGDVNALRNDLREAFGMDEKEVTINQLTRHIIVKGHKKPEIEKFFEGASLVGFGGGFKDTSQVNNFNGWMRSINHVLIQAIPCICRSDACLYVQYRFRISMEISMLRNLYNHNPIILQTRKDVTGNQPC